MLRISLVSFFILITIPSLLFPQDTVTISGTITSAITFETLISASVSVLNTSTGTSSKEYGFFPLTLSKESYTIEFNAVSLKLKQQEVQLPKNLVLNVTLEEQATELESIVVKTTGRRSLTNAQMGIDRLTIAGTKTIPMLRGDGDVLKTIQLLPAIKSAGEGSSGFFARVTDTLSYDKGEFVGYSLLRKVS